MAKTRQGEYRGTHYSSLTLLKSNLKGSYEGGGPSLLNALTKTLHRRTSRMTDKMVDVSVEST